MRDLLGLRPDRRVGVRLSRAEDVVGCVAVPGIHSGGQSAGLYLFIAAYVENSIFCRDGVGQNGVACQLGWSLCARLVSGLGAPAPGSALSRPFRGLQVTNPGACCRHQRDFGRSRCIRLACRGPCAGERRGLRGVRSRCNAGKTGEPVPANTFVFKHHQIQAGLSAASRAAGPASHLRRPR
jgi:hypothetical protein